MAQSELDTERTSDKLSGAIEAAFLLVIAQNTILLSKPVISVAIIQTITASHIILFLIPLVNIMNVFANWITARIYKSSYDTSMLLEDVLGSF